MWSVGAKQQIPYNTELWVVEVRFTKISNFIAGVAQTFFPWWAKSEASRWTAGQKQAPIVLCC